MPNRKEIRILDADGKIVDADQDVHVTTRPEKDGPDEVKWRVFKIGAGPGSDFKIGFGSAVDPFSMTLIDVPFGAGSALKTVTGVPGTYKYRVFRVQANGSLVETDDPNIIIKS